MKLYSRGPYGFWEVHTALDGPRLNQSNCEFHSCYTIITTITSVLGLKQGDNLSRIEFNLFFDDVSEIFDESCDPLPIEEEKKLSHLAFADDLAMFSLSKAGLQQCLNNLLIYCNN